MYCFNQSIVTLYVLSLLSNLDRCLAVNFDNVAHTFLIEGWNEFMYLTDADIEFFSY